MEFYSDEEIGIIIRQCRKNCGFTQEQLGIIVGVQKSAVQKWESGKVKNIKRSTLQVLAVTLRIKPTILIGIKEED